MSFIQESVLEKINKIKENDNEFKKEFSVAEKEHKIISEFIKRRKNLGLTQKDFATKVGVKQQAISTFERVEESPTLKRLVQLADILDIEIKVVKKYKISNRFKNKKSKECIT